MCRHAELKCDTSHSDAMDLLNFLIDLANKKDERRCSKGEKNELKWREMLKRACGARAMLAGCGMLKGFTSEQDEHVRRHTGESRRIGSEIWLPNRVRSLSTIIVPVCACWQARRDH